MSEAQQPGTGILDRALHLSGGFSAAERPWVLDALSGLTPHLSRWDPGEIGLDVSVKHRDGKEQEVTLRANLPRYPPLVAGSRDRNLDRGLVAARRELIRQIEDATKKREPKSNRLHRGKPA